MNYKIEGYGSWFIVNTNDKKKAHSEGVKEYGRGNVTKVSIAKDIDIKEFIAVKGVGAIEEI